MNFFRKIKQERIKRNRDKLKSYVIDELKKVTTKLNDPKITKDDRFKTVIEYHRLKYVQENGYYL